MSVIDGQRVAILRKRRGWAQNELAEAAGVTPAMISRLERNLQEDYQLSAISKIAKALGVTIDSLLETTSQPPNTQGLVLDLQKAIDKLIHQPADIQKQVARMIEAYLASR